MITNEDLETFEDAITAFDCGVSFTIESADVLVY